MYAVSFASLMSVLGLSVLSPSFRNFGNGRMDGRTYGRTDVRTDGQNIPCILQNIAPLGPLPKKGKKKRGVDGKGGERLSKRECSGVGFRRLLQHL